MKFNKLNKGQYNMMEVKETLKCSICNEDTNYIDYWNGIGLRKIKSQLHR